MPAMSPEQIRAQIVARRAAMAAVSQAESQLAAGIPEGTVYSEDPDPKPVFVVVRGVFAEITPESLAPKAATP